MWKQAFGAAGVALCLMTVGPAAHAASVGSVQADGSHQGWITGYDDQGQPVSESQQYLGSIGSSLQVDYHSPASSSQPFLNVNGDSQVQPADPEHSGMSAYDWASTLSVQSTFEVVDPGRVRFDYLTEFDAADGAVDFAVYDDEGNAVFSQASTITTPGAFDVHSILHLDRGQYSLAAELTHGGTYATGGSTGSFSLQATPVPVPSAALGGVALLAGLATTRTIRRRMQA